MPGRDKFSNDEVKQIRHHRASRHDHEQANAILRCATHAPVTNPETLMLSAKIIAVFGQEGKKHRLLRNLVDRDLADHLISLAYDIETRIRH